MFVLCIEEVRLEVETAHVILFNPKMKISGKSTVTNVFCLSAVQDTNIINHLHILFVNLCTVFGVLLIKYFISRRTKIIRQKNY